MVQPQMTAADDSDAFASEDQRKNERLLILGNLRGEVMVYQPMTITEISPAGVTVETAFPFHIDSLHDLRIQLSEQSVIVKGRVVHSSVADVNDDVVRYRSGLEFVELPARSAAAIESFVERIKTARFGE